MSSWAPVSEKAVNNPGERAPHVRFSCQPLVEPGRSTGAFPYQGLKRIDLEKPIWLFLSHFLVAPECDCLLCLGQRASGFHKSKGPPLQRDALFGLPIQRPIWRSTRITGFHADDGRPLLSKVRTSPSLRVMAPMQIPGPSNGELRALILMGPTTTHLEAPKSIGTLKVVTFGGRVPEWPWFWHPNHAECRRL